MRLFQKLSGMKDRHLEMLENLEFDGVELAELFVEAAFRTLQSEAKGSKRKGKRIGEIQAAFFFWFWSFLLGEEENFKEFWEDYLKTTERMVIERVFEERKVQEALKLDKK